MLEVFTLYINTCINSLYKTVFYPVEGFSGDLFDIHLLSHLSNHQERVDDSGKQRI